MQETFFFSLPKKVEVKMEVENKEAAKDAKEGLVFTITYIFMTQYESSMKIDTRVRLHSKWSPFDKFILPIQYENIYEPLFV